MPRASTGIQEFSKRLFGATHRLEISAVIAEAETGEIYSAGIAEAVGIPTALAHRELRLLANAGLLRQARRESRRVLYERVPHPYWEFAVQAVDHEERHTNLAVAREYLEEARADLTVGRSDWARDHLRRLSLEIGQSLSSADETTSANLVPLWKQALALARETGDHALTESLSAGLVSLCESLVRTSPDAAQPRRALADAWLELATLRNESGDATAAVELSRQAIRMTERLVSESPESIEAHMGLLNAQGAYYGLVRERGDLTLARQLSGSHLDTARALLHLASDSVLPSLEAERAYERASDLASFLGEFEAARDYWLHAIATCDSLHPRSEPDMQALVAAYERLANLAETRGHAPDRDSATEKALSARRDKADSRSGT